MTRPCGACGRPRQVHGGADRAEFCRDCRVQREAKESVDELEAGEWVRCGPILRWRPW